jgi:hypothetical protein
MQNDQTVAALALKELSQSLGLEYEPQDWGIVNADGSRLSEFIDYYETHPDLSATQRFELGGLILASANEQMRDGVESVPQHLQTFLEGRSAAFRAHLEYWSSLQDSHDFPLATWLRTFVSRI